MSLNDLLSDSVARIRNAQSVFLSFVDLVSSKFVKSAVRVLEEEGYISSFEIVNDGKFDMIRVRLKYHKSSPVIVDIKRFSKPGCRVYYSVEDLYKNKFYSGLGTLVLSTSKGVISDREARKLNVGGEVLFGVF